MALAGRDVEIRSAGPDDVSALLNLYRELQPDDPEMGENLARDRFNQMLAHPGMVVFLAFAGEIAVSTITLVIIPNLTRGGAPYALIENVVTHVAHRQHGYAGALIRHAIAHAWEAGCYKVMLLSGSKNPATLDFYRHCGFVQDKTGFQLRRPDGL
ncbi:MAG: GNAT family N-acetyltransferase [Hoeflea sp.]|uniref:GNAT family N-acetyltransferase n=1 Tax=Hoeflea sp. TaxID=1940281 RepID=UPI001DFDA5BD|nr:GNAT family N-acetyltransferase [Hoeflea sp.]MBU4527237.1 GNAT family N-acetyltransferase [Alphaproteobacteria bacterium]MBU4546980.1 GNAT family N-acetyltransferase [Alphaproteobacteria bacterium]MBU4551508.1 GNAT family N-acetyltransferase [Alphaproteobacteria bacterium]MBV1725513.1 GNAT family N-acetyltransferase [Hoeflea sp.]MBV1759561.1 GNAT family N-acetyltransferase [Hoeflea sp.]